MSTQRIMSVISIASLLMAGAAWAQSGAASGAATTEAAGAAKAGENRVELSSRADAQADAQMEARMEEIKQRGAKASAKARTQTEAKLDAEAKKVNEEATRQGDAKVAARLAGEFGGTADAMIEEKDRLEASWGEMMIAHTLDANARSEIMIKDLVTLRHRSVGWGQIAAGLGLRLNEVQSAVQAESRVAMGQTRADGKVAVIRSAGARANAGASTGVNASGARVGAGVETGVGVKIGN